MKMEEEILIAKGKNWARLVMERADLIAESKKDDIDSMISILNGEVYDEAVNQIALEIKLGFYDKMLMPVECNK